MNKERQHIAHRFNQPPDNKSEPRPEHLRFSESMLRRTYELLEAGYIIEDLNNFNGSSYDTTFALGDKREKLNHEASWPIMVSSTDPEQAAGVLKKKIEEMLGQYRRRNQPLEDHLL